MTGERESWVPSRAESTVIALALGAAMFVGLFVDAAWAEVTSVVAIVLAVLWMLFLGAAAS